MKGKLQENDFSNLFLMCHDAFEEGALSPDLVTKESTILYVCRGVRDALNHWVGTMKEL